MRKRIVGSLAVIACVLLFRTQAYAEVLGKWDFDQGSGTTLSDVSGNGNTGILQNMTDSNWVTGVSGHALSFNGVNQWVNFPTTSGAIHSLSGAMTVELWLKANAGDQVGNVSLIFDKSHGFYGHNGWCLQYMKDDQTLQFAFGRLDGWSEVRANNVFDGKWHHVAGTYDMSDLKLYIDGNLKASQPNRLEQNTNDQPLEMGSSLYAGTRYRYFAGSLDDAALYNVALDASIIKQHATVTPEPASMLLFGVGGLAMVSMKNRKRKPIADRGPKLQ
ncbi:MAG: LamG-like jellyroll fold domain-containing protein [Candidatus Omnitrophota bacterium]